ncbi:MAG: 50S ribosomal protein L23 [Thermomicrobiales bacterium]
MHREANKFQIREAVEKTFNVKVKAVNTLNMPQLRRRADHRQRPRLEEGNRHPPGG